MNTILGCRSKKIISLVLFIYLIAPILVISFISSVGTLPREKEATPFSVSYISL